MKIKSCKHCGEQFNLHSQRKQEVGGYINECPDCVEELETETKEVIRAFTTGDGKMASIQILKFEDKEQAERRCEELQHMFDWMEQQSGKPSDHKDVYVEERDL